MSLFKTTACVLALMVAAPVSAATLDTMKSPTAAGDLPNTISKVGGIVFDIIGLSDARVVAQAAASTLFVGNTGSSNPLNVGSLSGFTNATITALGGGIKEMAVRISLFDGDSQAGNFDFNDNTLEVNGIGFGNFSDVATQRTDGTGNPIGMSTFGFGNNTLETGFFYNNDATDMANLFASLGSTLELDVDLIDADPGDQFYNFTQGIDQSLINVGSGPVVTPPTTPGGAVPLPAAGWMLVAALGGLGWLKRRQSV